MKRILDLLIFSLIILSSCQDKKNGVEDDLYNCLLNSLTEEEKNKLAPIIIDFEKHLISTKVLASSAPKSYLNFYKKIAETGEHNFSNEFNFSEKISFLNRRSPNDTQDLLECHSKIFQTEKYKNSKLYELTKEMQSLKQHRITPVIIAKTTIKYLNEDDFELDYNRFNTLMFIESLK